MKKILLLTLLFSASAWASDQLQLDQNASQSCQGQPLLANNVASCCDAHKGTCGCSPEGNVCCDGSVIRDCPCEDKAPKKK